MEVQELKHLIKEKTIPSFMIFTGEEWLVQKLYIEQIAKVVNLEIQYIDKVSDIIGTLGSKSLFSQNYLYVVRDDKEFMTEEKLQEKVINNLNQNMLILELTSADKRLKLLKTYKTSTYEFNALKSDILKRYIQREIDLSDRNCEILMEICEYSYGHCLLEIDKIYNYYMGVIKSDDTPTLKLMPFNVDIKDIDVNKVFKILLEDGTLYVPPRDTLWDFIKAFLQNKPSKAYELYQELKELQSPTFAILTNLYNNAKQVLQVQICTSNDIAKTTGLTAWQIRNAKECINKYKARDLAVLMRLIQKVESNIKQGKLDEQIAIDYIFSSFF